MITASIAAALRKHLPWPLVQVLERLKASALNPAWLRRRAVSIGKPLSRPFRQSDVALMYSGNSIVRTAYPVDFIAWGNRANAWSVYQLHRRGIRYIASVWALTAGARQLHQHADLQQALALDLEGHPIVVPWRAHLSWHDQREYFGCTNHPIFQQWVKNRVRQVMASGADGLHVDDHLGVAQTVYLGGGFCDYCMAGFRRYLSSHATREQRELIGNIELFDYRLFVREQVTDMNDYIARRTQLPLADLFLQYHLESAAEFTAELGRLASEIVGGTVLLSANAGLPDLRHLLILPRLSHITAEIPHIHRPRPMGGGLLAPKQRYELLLNGFRLAKLYKLPLLLTAKPDDWAWVVKHNAVDLVRLWIGLAYAHGHLFLVPALEGQYYYTLASGGGYYHAQIKDFAPIYRFIKDHADWFDDFQSVSLPQQPIEGVLTLARQHPSGRLAIHLLDVAMEGDRTQAPPRYDARVRVPASLVTGTNAALLSLDGTNKRLQVTYVEHETVEIMVEEFRIWSIIAIE